MAFKGTLVARHEIPSAAPYLGHPLTVIDLLQPNGESSVTPTMPAPESRDRIIEGVTGDDVAVVRRKLVEIDLAIDYISSETKGRIERLYHDGRPLLFCPNFDQETRWSIPFQRSENDFLERATVAVTRSSNAHVWDATDQLMRTWTGTDLPLSFNGHWTRYAGIYDIMINVASDPHPTNASHGWVNVTGSSIFTYTESMLTPVVLQQGVTDEKGVLMVESPSGVAALIRHIGTGLTTSLPVGATVLVKAYGQVTVELTESTGAAAIVYDTVSYTGDGTWRLVRLASDNPDSASAMDIHITAEESATADQVIILSSVFIGTTFDEGSFGDWSDGTNGATSVTLSGADHMLPAMSFSCLLRRHAGVRQHLLNLNGTDDLSIGWTDLDAIEIYDVGSSVIESFANVGADNGISDGDWVHLVIQASHADGWELFTNTVAHADNGNSGWDAERYGAGATLGGASASGSFPPVGAKLGAGGMSHARLDGRAWTAAEITDHYNTFFSDRGRGIVEPMFGKTVIIDEFSMIPRGVDNPMQWVGNLVLRELGPDTDFAPLIRQEGDV